jgi:hypothetical protein
MKILFESISGKVVTKEFKTIIEAKSFITKNKSKIKSGKIMESPLDTDFFGSDEYLYPHHATHKLILENFEPQIRELLQDIAAENSKYADYDILADNRDGFYLITPSNKKVKLTDLTKYVKKTFHLPKYNKMKEYFIIKMDKNM